MITRIDKIGFQSIPIYKLIHIILKLSCFGVQMSSIFIVLSSSNYKQHLFHNKIVTCNISHLFIHYLINDILGRKSLRFSFGSAIIGCNVHSRDSRVKMNAIIENVGLYKNLLVVKPKMGIM